MGHSHVVPKVHISAGDGCGGSSLGPLSQPCGGGYALDLLFLYSLQDLTSYSPIHYFNPLLKLIILYIKLVIFKLLCAFCLLIGP